MPTPRRQPLQNVLWLVGERLARAALAAVVLGCVARHLEPAGFGRLNFAITASLIATALATLGLEGVVVNELVRQPERAGPILGSAFRLRLAAGAGTALLLNLIAWTVPNLHDDALLLSIVSLGLLVQPVEVVDLWFQRHLDSRRTAVARFVGVAAGATLKLYLVAANAGLTAFAWAQVADLVFIGTCLAWAGWHSPHPSSAWRWDAEIAHLLWRRGAPLALSAVAVAFTLRLDQVLVRQWLGDTEAGLYFASVRLTEMASFAGAAMALSLFPALATAHVQMPRELVPRLQALFDALSALGWIVALGCTLGGTWVIRWIYGPAYGEASAVLAVQGWACLVALNAQARWAFTLLATPTIINLGAAALHCATLLVAARTWMPVHGAIGAAAALLLANLVSGVASTWLFPTLRPCARVQLQGFLIPFTPRRWGDLLRQFR